MSKYLVKFEELKFKNQNMKSVVKQIEECIDSIEKGKNKLDWNGPANDKFILAYDNYLLSLKKILNALTFCLMLTNSFYDNYSEAYEKIKKEFQKLHEELMEKCQKERFNVE